MITDTEADNFPGAFLETAIELLLHKDVLDEADLGDANVVMAALRDNRELTQNIGFLKSLREDFVASAVESFQRGRPEVAIVLFATANEHALNHFLSDVLMRTNTDWEKLSDDLLWASITCKISKMLPKAGARLSKDVAKGVTDVASLRNKFVHGRSRSIFSGESTIGLASLDAEVEQHPLQSLLENHNRLLTELDTALGSRYPARPAARLAAQRAMGRIIADLEGKNAPQDHNPRES